MPNSELGTPEPNFTQNDVSAELTHSPISDEYVTDEPPKWVINLEQDAYQKWFRQSLRLREWYAKGILIGMGVEAAACLVIVFGLGTGRLHLSPWVGSTFVLGVFGQITGLARVVVRHLFPRSDGLK